MLKIGSHLSSSKGYLHMGKEAVSIGANTFQFFTRNPRGSKAKEIDPEDVRKFREFAVEQGIDVILAHAPYTLNACSKEAHTREFALMTMEDDLRRMEYTPGNLYNFHRAVHTGQGSEEGIRLIADTLNRILKPEQTTTVLLETMAGKVLRWDAVLRNWRRFWNVWNCLIIWASAWIPVMCTMRGMILFTIWTVCWRSSTG